MISPTTAVSSANVVTVLESENSYSEVYTDEYSGGLKTQPVKDEGRTGVSAYLHHMGSTHRKVKHPRVSTATLPKLRQPSPSQTT